MKQTNPIISNHHQLLLFGLILLLWLLFKLIFCCYLGFCFFCWVKWIEFIRIRMFKIYLKVFKTLFKSVQYIHNTFIYIYIYSLLLTNQGVQVHTLTITWSRPCLSVGLIVDFGSQIGGPEGLCCGWVCWCVWWWVLVANWWFFVGFLFLGYYCEILGRVVDCREFLSHWGGWLWLMCFVGSWWCIVNFG